MTTQTIRLAERMRHVGLSPDAYRKRRERERRPVKDAVRERKAGQGGKIW